MKKFYSMLVAVMIAAVAFAHEGRIVLPRTMPSPFGAKKSLVAKHAKQKLAISKTVRKAPEVAENYVKVNSVPEDWEGEYLIVYEECDTIMNGGLTDNLDAIGNTVAVTIVDEEIASTDETDAASFTIAAVEGGYSIKGKGGLYMGQTSDANGLLSNATTQYVNTLSIDEDGNAVILSSGGAYLRYNAAKNQRRFRYYKSATYENQKPIALYKKGGEKTEVVKPELVVLPEGLVTEDYALDVRGYVANQEDWEDEKIYQTVQVGFDGTDVYIQGLSYWMPEAYVKGTLQDGQIVVPNCQYMGEDDYGYKNYFMSYVWSEEDVNYVPSDYALFYYDVETRSIVMDEEYMYAETDDPTSDILYDYWYSVTLTPGEAVEPEAVEVPENLVVTEYKMSATSIGSSSEDDSDESNGDEEGSIETKAYSTHVMVGFDGNDVYIQGLSEWLPEAWVKGTLSGNGKTVTIPSGQYLGKYEMELFGVSDYLFISAVNLETQEYEDIVFTYDTDAKTFSTAQDVLVLNDVDDTYERYNDITLTPVVEMAATPATPSVVLITTGGEYGASVQFEIPTVDVNGNEMLTSKLSYVIYVEKDGQAQKLTLEAGAYEELAEDMTEIPYTFTDEWDIYAGGYMIYLNQGADEISSWTKIGVQSIYTGGGERHESEIGWYEIEDEVYEDGIVGVKSQSSNVIYDMQGRRVSKPTHGLYIVNGKKVLVK